MAEIVRMPKLSDTMTEGVVAEWHKEVGDMVKAGDLLAEIETDKATMEYESFQEGVLLYKGVETGEAKPVESILAILGEEGEDYKALLESEGGDNGAEAKAEGDDEGKEAGKEDDGDKEESAEERPAARQDSGDSGSREAESRDGRLKASPLARKMAQELGIDLGDVKGTGEGGRIVKRDIESYTPKTSKTTHAPAYAVGKESYRDENISQMRKTIARRLSESKFSAPHFYLTIELDMDRAMAARKAINKAIEPAKISVNDLVIKAAAAALRKHPQVNASFMGDKIRYNDHIHIGVAVAVDEGLLVPVVRFADTKPLTVINDEVRDLAEKARNKKLQPADWEGNTFTISNLGMFGIEEFTAVINPPDSAILAIGTIVEKPVVKDGQITVGHRMKVTMSCDHRSVDGAVGSAFLQTFRKYMEDPVLIIA